jgi:hypothetical protein
MLILINDWVLDHSVLDLNLIGSNEVLRMPVWIMLLLFIFKIKSILLDYIYLYCHIPEIMNRVRVINPATYARRDARTKG